MPLQHAGPRRVLQAAQLLKKIAVNKSVCNALHLVTNQYKRNPQQAPSEEHHARTHLCPHTNTEQHQHIYPRQSRILWITWRHRVICMQITAFAAIWIYHLHLLLPSSLKVKLQADRNTEKSPCLQTATFGNGCVS